MKYESELMQHKSKGIRIFDKIDTGVHVELLTILGEIPHGELYNWSILFLDGMGDLGSGKSIVDFMHQINDSKKGHEISWKDLNLLASKFYQVMEIMLIGCKDKSFLHRYESDYEMYESCDFSIEMIDCVFWEIFSKDEMWIDRLSKKFKKTELLEPDFLK